MKIKHFVALFVGITLFIAGCADKQNPEELAAHQSKANTTIPTTNIISTYPTETKDDEDGYPDITFASGVYPAENWGRTQSDPYDGDAVPNLETAVNVATQIFNSLPKNPYEDQYKPEFVFFDEQDKVWIVSFWKRESTQTLDGAALTIVIRQSDCAVLSIHRE